MKKVTIHLIIVLSTVNCGGQVVLSSCTAPDSVITKYKNDADRLALRHVFKINSTYIDSAIIPPTTRDTFLTALIAVYNATSLPARDTIVAMFNVHTFKPNINYFYVAADSNLSWMQQLRLGNLVTGNAQVDNIISTYYLRIERYNSDLTPHVVLFKSDTNFNIPVIADYFKTVAGVQYAEPQSVIGDGNNIIADAVYSDRIVLTYSVGWGDCPSGCTERRNWEFNVYFDCSVVFVRSYGNPLPATSGSNSIEKKPISISPDPVNEIIYINGISKPFNYTISNLLGQELTNGQSAKNYLTDFRGMPSGLYILTIQVETQFAIFKILRE